jgi:molybdopterin converting factor small subunit
LKIIIKAFGPEITSLLAREKIVDFEPGSTADDLVSMLEEEILVEHGRTVSILGSSFTVLINGRNLKALRDRALRDGDLVAILSPIGGG